MNYNLYLINECDKRRLKYNKIINSLFLLIILKKIN